MRFKLLVSLLALFMIGGLSVTAQEQSTPDNKIIIIEKTIDNNGEQHHETIRLEGAEAEAYLNQNDNINIDIDENLRNIEVHVEDDDEGASAVWITGVDHEEVIELGEGVHEYHFIEDDGETEVSIINTGDRDAIQRDVKVIIQKDGGADNDQELLQEFGVDDIDMDDVKTININQDNSTRTLKIKLKNGKTIKRVIEGERDMGNHFMEDRTNGFMRGGGMHHNPCDENRPFLGISMRAIHSASGDEELLTTSTHGVEILNVTENSGAAAAQLNSGDIITAIDGKSIFSTSDISNIIRSHQVGDVIKINFNRNGNIKTIAATLGKKECNKRKHQHWERFDQGNHSFSRFNKNYKRNPCKPLIGFFHSSSMEKEGIVVNRVIDETPAARQNLKKGDVVLSFDGVAVDSWNQLISLRDEHEAGDRFKMVILRDGKKEKIKANFNDCPTADEVEAPEIYEFDLPEDIVVEGSAINFSVYPNPSQGQVTVEYQGSAGPLSMQISDITGKVLINRTFADFDGNFKQEFDFSDAAEGTLLVRFQQGEDVVVRQIILQKAN